MYAGITVQRKRSGSSHGPVCKRLLSCIMPDESGTLQIVVQNNVIDQSLSFPKLKSTATGFLV
jgi:hypothetical protein